MTREELLELALTHARPGLALEFGVADGHTLRILAHHRPGQVFGFDSFQGLPEPWRPGHPQGIFACDQPDVPGATIIPGPFADTLPPWFATHALNQIGLLHIDCDLYTSTATVLTHLHYLHPGTVIVFDELTGYPNWINHEHRALLEWVATTRTRLTPLACLDQQAAFTVT